MSAPAKSEPNWRITTALATTNKAIHYLRLAGGRAVARGAVVEAEGYYRRALELLSESPQASERDRLELALQMALGEVLWTSKSWSHPDAYRAYTRALELAEELGETTQTETVLTGRFAFAFGRAQIHTGARAGTPDVGRGGTQPGPCLALHS